MSGEQLRTQAEQELQAEAKADLEEVQLPKEQKEGVAKETQKKLDTIKKEIESGNFGMESLKTNLDALNEINNSDMKSIYLGSIITALNKKGFYVLGFNQKGINLAGGYQINGKTAPGEEVDSYETILNNYMKSGSFTKADFQKALLYRSSEMKNFISQNTDSTGALLNSPNVDQYAVQLLKKYPDLDQNIQKDPEGGLMYVEKDEKIYTNWKQAMREKIKENPEDADFLVSYFDSKFYGSNEKFAGNGSPFESYKSTSQEIKTKLDTFTNSFTNEELYSLGIRNTSELQQFKTSISQDPVGTIGESIKKGFGIGIILGIIGLLFGGKKGFLVGFLGGTAIAGNSALVKDLFTKGTEAVTSGAGTFLDRVSEKYKKIAGAFSDASPEQQNIAENLFKDENFQKAPASVLNIFNNPQFNTLDLQKTELAKYGIDLTEANKADYAAVFAGLIKNRADANIHIQGTETVNNFFTKTNDAVVVTGATPDNVGDVSEESTEELSNNEILNRDTEARIAVQEINEFRSQGMSDLYIFSRIMELGYSITPTTPKWAGKNVSTMNMLGSVWYITTLPFRLFPVAKTIASYGGNFMIGGLHESTRNGLIGKGIEKTGGAINWIGSGLMKMLQVELRWQKFKLNSEINAISNNVNKSVTKNTDVVSMRNQLTKINEIDAAIKANDLDLLKKLCSEYFNQARVAKINVDKIQTNNDQKKAELEKIETEIKNIEAHTKEELTKLEEKAKTLNDPKKIEALREEAKRITAYSNQNIEKFNSEYAHNISKLPEAEIRALSESNKFANTFIQANDGVANFLKEFNGGKTKAFVGIGILSMVYHGSDGIAEMWNNGFSEENKNDLLDLGLGLIPIYGGYHDLKIAWEGKDLNDRELSDSERLIRTGFGIVGLVPGLGMLVKGVAKGSTTIVRGTTHVVQGVQSLGKLMTFGLLGFSIGTATKEIILD